MDIDVGNTIATTAVVLAFLVAIAGWAFTVLQSSRLATYQRKQIVLDSVLKNIDAYLDELGKFQISVSEWAGDIGASLNKLDEADAKQLATSSLGAQVAETGALLAAGVVDDSGYLRDLVGAAYNHLVAAYNNLMESESVDDLYIKELATSVNSANEIRTWIWNLRLANPSDVLPEPISPERLKEIGKDLAKEAAQTETGS